MPMTGKDSVPRGAACRMMSRCLSRSCLPPSLLFLLFPSFQPLPLRPAPRLLSPLLILQPLWTPRNANWKQHAKRSLGPRPGTDPGWANVLHPRRGTGEWGSKLIYWGTSLGRRKRNHKRVSRYESKCSCKMITNVELKTPQMFKKI